MGPLDERKRETSSFQLNFRTDTFLKPNNPFTIECHNGRFRQLSVRFLDCQQYRDVPSRSELTCDEMHSIWYSEDEHVAIRKANALTVKMMMASSNGLDTENHCTRGLECRTREGWQQRVRNKMLVKYAVLQEQEVQRSEDVVDPDLLEQVSSEASYRAREEARDRGLNDELEVVLIRSQCTDKVLFDTEEVESMEDLQYFSLFSI